MPISGMIMPNMGMSVRRPRKRSSRQVPKLRTNPDSSIGLAGALFSTTQQRMLGLLFGQPDRRFFANELIALTGSGSGAVQRELRRLTGSGLVNSTKEGSRRYLQANAVAPLFSELRSIVLKTVAASEPLKSALSPLVPQIELAFIYGSVAKRRETASSDLDLLVVSESLRLEQLYSALASAEQQLSRKVSVTLYTPKEYRRRLADKNPFLARVLAGDHITLIGSARELVAAR
jgi:predicted nucleotidyltransferase